MTGPFFSSRSIISPSTHGGQNRFTRVTKAPPATLGIPDRYPPTARAAVSACAASSGFGRSGSTNERIPAMSVSTRPSGGRLSTTRRAPRGTRYKQNCTAGCFRLSFRTSPRVFSFGIIFDPWPAWYHRRTASYAQLVARPRYRQSRSGFGWSVGAFPSRLVPCPPRRWARLWWLGLYTRPARVASNWLGTPSSRTRTRPAWAWFARLVSLPSSVGFWPLRGGHYSTAPAAWTTTGRFFFFFCFFFSAPPFFGLKYTLVNHVSSCFGDIHLALHGLTLNTFPGLQFSSAAVRISIVWWQLAASVDPSRLWIVPVSTILLPPLTNPPHSTRSDHLFHLHSSTARPAMAAGAAHLTRSRNRTPEMAQYTYNTTTKPAYDAELQTTLSEETHERGSQGAAGHREVPFVVSVPVSDSPCLPSRSPFAWAIPGRTRAN